MSMRNHISRLTSNCFGVLQQIRCIRHSLSSRARTMLATCFVFVWLDYCNAMFTGLPRYDLDRLQAVQNAAVRLITGARKFDHVTSLLRERHWLPVEQRIILRWPSWRISAFTARRLITLWITSSHHRLQLPTYTCGQPVPVACVCLGQRLPPGTDPLQLLVHVCGTVCLPLSHRQAPWPCSKNIWWLFLEQHMIDTYYWYFLLTL